jgi:hypothetical protein
MSSPTARPVDRRDAAVTAALAGIVLVILGYASGIGLSKPAEVSATLARPVPAPATAASSPAPIPVPSVAEPVLAGGLPAAAVPHPAATPPKATTTPTTPAPSAAPSATPTGSPDPVCPPNLVETVAGELPLVGPVTTLVSGVVAGLITTPLVGRTSADGGASSSDPISCTVGAILGPTCCSTTAARTTTDDAR